MNTVDNSSVTASARGGVGSNVMGIQSTATQVNTIRRSRLTSLRTNGEVEPGTDNPGATRRPGHGGLRVGVVGGSRLERGGACEDGRTLRIDHPSGCRRVDRVVQSAVKMVIEPIFERDFAPSSYGFRPGRGCKDALREVERLLRGGYEHVVDVDIKGYFDNIPHEALLTLVKERIADGKVLGLIEQFLKQGVLEEGMEIEPETGSPQGGIVSPLLANVYLNPLDWLMAELGFKSVVYADDIVVMAPSTEVAKQALEQLKSWFAYFKQAHPSEHEAMDRWVRMRLRSILRKRHKGKGRGRGFDHFKWPNRYFEKLGLFSLERARKEQMSLRRGAPC